MRNTLWTFGCSFTAEYHPVGLESFETNYDKYKAWRGGNLPDVWPTLLAKKLDYNVFNSAIGGNSNYGIISQFNDIADKIKKDDILIFGWTSVLRFTLANFKDKIFNHVLICDSDYSGTYVSKKGIDEIFHNRSNPFWTYEIHKWIHMINAFAYNIGAKAYHWTSDGTIFNSKTKFVNDNRFILPKSDMFNTFDLLGYLTLPIHYKCNDYCAKIHDETKQQVKDTHMGEYGHKMQAEYFYDHIMGIDQKTKKYEIE